MQHMLNAWRVTESRKKILLLRHGAIETGSDEKRFIGQADLPLSDVGRQQARYWSACLDGVSLAPIMASDLSRCQETARIIAAGNLGRRTGQRGQAALARCLPKTRPGHGRFPAAGW
jgi:broad specificity phosphatase PhoE